MRAMTEKLLGEIPGNVGLVILFIDTSLTDHRARRSNFHILLQRYENESNHRDPVMNSNHLSVLRLKMILQESAHVHRCEKVLGQETTLKVGRKERVRALIITEKRELKQRTRSEFGSFDLIPDSQVRALCIPWCRRRAGLRVECLSNIRMH